MTDTKNSARIRKNSPAIPRGHSLGEFANYLDASALVDKLIAGDFTPAKVSIIGHDPVLVERVRGRLGYGRIALSGAITGFWMGLIFALLIGAGIEVTPEGGINYLPQQFFSVLFVASGLGMLFQVVRYSLNKQKRGFISAQMPIASRYEVVIPEADAVEAHKILGSTSGAQ